MTQHVVTRKGCAGAETTKRKSLELRKAEISSTWGHFPHAVWRVILLLQIPIIKGEVWRYSPQSFQYLEFHQLFLGFVHPFYGSLNLIAVMKVTLRLQMCSSDPSVLLEEYVDREEMKTTENSLKRAAATKNWAWVQTEINLFIYGDLVPSDDTISKELSFFKSKSSITFFNLCLQYSSGIFSSRL